MGYLMLFILVFGFAYMVFATMEEGSVQVPKEFETISGVSNEKCRKEAIENMYSRNALYR